MFKYLKRKYSFSDDGTRDLMHAIKWSAILNISYMIPIGFAFHFLKELMNKGQTKAIYIYIGASLIIMFIMFLISKKQYNSTFTTTYKESAKKRIQIAEKLRTLPLEFFNKKDISDLSANIMDDITEIETIFSHAVPQLYGSIISGSLILVFLFIFNFKLAISMFWVVPFSFLVFYIAKKSIDKSNVELYNSKRIILEKVQQGVDYMQEIKAYNYEGKYLSEFNQMLDNYESSLRKIELLGASAINISYVFLRLGVFSVTVFGAFMYFNGEVNMFTYFITLIITGGVYNPFISSINNMAALLYLNVRLDRMKEIEQMPIQEGKKEFKPNNFDIEFKNVSFSYEEDKQTIKDISFVAKQGEITALVGPSGGGKTTVTKLMARFWDIDKGNIYLGGQDISKVDPETLLINYSIVFQDVVLFNNSILENARIGRKDATDEEVIEALKLSGCFEFIDKLEEGYNTKIGENGQKLSGGERQRISIARAILKDAPIILLDEASASLDAENESKIQKALSNLIKNKTVVIIAHRLRTVMNADTIVVIKDGSIIEEGNSKILIENKESFFNKMLETS